MRNNSGINNFNLDFRVLMQVPFYTPVFRRDVLWYGDVRPSVRPSGSPSIRPSVTVFRTFLLHALRY